MDGGQADLLVGLEGVVPGEGEGVDVGAVGGDGEAGLDEGERAGVGQERGAALLEGGGVREAGALDGRGAEVAHGAEVVVGGGRVALRVGGGDVLAERAVEVDGRGLLLVDRQHDVGRHRGAVAGGEGGGGGDRGWGLGVIASR